MALSISHVLLVSIAARTVSMQVKNGADLAVRAVRAVQADMAQQEVLAIQVKDGADLELVRADMAQQEVVAIQVKDGADLELVRADMAQQAVVSAEHAWGLEHDHSQSAWPLADGDADKLRAIRAFINRRKPDGEAPWNWEDKGKNANEWNYGLVKLTATGTTETLALHMLHRHGLAPLLASRADGFDAALELAQSGRSNGQLWLEVFVETESACADVQALFEMLKDVSLGGLRHLHSYDHDDFERAPSPQISKLQKIGVLQAMRSASMVTWMEKQLVGEHVAAARDAFTEVIEDFSGSSHAPVVFEFLTWKQHQVDVSTADGITSAADMFHAQLFDFPLCALQLADQNGPQSTVLDLAKSQSDKAPMLQATVVWEEVAAITAWGSGRHAPSTVIIRLNETQIKWLCSPQGAVPDPIDAEHSCSAAEAAAPPGVQCSPTNPATDCDTTSTAFLKVAYGVVQDYVVKHVVAHKKGMLKHHSVIWAGEEAQLFQLSKEVLELFVEDATACEDVNTDISQMDSGDALKACGNAGPVCAYLKKKDGSEKRCVYTGPQVH